MSELYPTKTRLALLRAGGDGAVWMSFHSNSYGQAFIEGRKVTARIQELQRAGWVRIGIGTGAFRQPCELTDAGRAVLDTHGGQRDD